MTSTTPSVTSVAKSHAWDRLRNHEGEIFQTTTNLTFTYEVKGNGIWFYRDGNRINQLLTRSEFEKGLDRCPLHTVAELSDLRDPSYLFGLLTDRRILA